MKTNHPLIGALIFVAKTARRIIKGWLAFLMLISIKLISRALYRFEVHWESDPPKDWSSVRIFMFLNHTTLFEPLFVGAIPIPALWRAAWHMVAPVADITLSRPIAGRIIRLLAHKVIPISRKRDATWSRFMSYMGGHDFVGIMPEGRMKRPNGLDKHGKPMTVKGGVTDILLALKTGDAFVLTSGGLHHIQAPGEPFPRIGKRIKGTMKVMAIEDLIHQANQKYPQETPSVSIAKTLEEIRDQDLERM